MKAYIAALCLLAPAICSALTPQEFQALYRAPKDGETCYKLYQAYATGDGVTQNDTQARKWLLAAHRCGVDGTRKLISAQPWRQALKRKPSIEIAEISDEEARRKGLDLVQLLEAKYKESFSPYAKPEDPRLTPEAQQEVRQLIAEGADLNVVYKYPNGNTESALGIASKHGDVETLALLIDHGADPCANGYMAITSAVISFTDIYHEHNDIISSMLPANRQQHEDVEPDGYRKRKAVLASRPVTNSEQALIRVTNFLIRNGLDLDMWSDSGISLVNLITGDNGVLVLPLYAEAGMDLNKPNNPNEFVVGAGFTKGRLYSRPPQATHALINAVRSYRAYIVAVLLKHHVDITVREGGKTALQIAAEIAARPSNNHLYNDYIDAIVAMLREAESRQQVKPAQSTKN